MKDVPSADPRGKAISRAWRSRTTTRALLFAGIAAACVYVVGDLVSGFIYNGSRTYSFRDQWISELTALGSPVRLLMVTVITVYGLLGFAFAVGILRAATAIATTPSPKAISTSVPRNSERNSPRSPAIGPTVRPSLRSA